MRLVKSEEEELVRWLEERLLQLRGVDTRPSRFGGIRAAYCVNGTEFAHFHPGVELDIRLTRKGITQRRKVLAADARVVLRASDWMTFQVHDAQDWPAALELLTAACEANRAKR